MTSDGRIQTARRTGAEDFRLNGVPFAAKQLDFWQWSASDMVANTMRGVLAEYIVALALGIADGMREEWAAWDLTMADATRIEVKSAAYVQSWQQAKPSVISFSVAKSRQWSETSGLGNESSRPAQIYVFALLAHMDQATLDPLDLDQWVFYVLPTSVLDARQRSQHSITLPSLAKLAEPRRFEQLADAVRECRAGIVS
ncbi:MAG: hypothetical protein R3D57_11140 [Hyphomicrobiaceae bacterium]